MDNDTGELWHVQVGENDVRTMTLDDLAEAFSAGLVFPWTNVWQDGMTEWLTLGDVAGLEEEPDQAETVAPPAAGTPPKLPAEAPPAFATAPPFAASQPSPSAWPAGASSQGPAGSFPGSGVFPSSAPMAARGPVMGAGPYAVTARSNAPTAISGYPPTLAPALDSKAPMSTAPMAFDLDDIDTQVKPKSKVGFWALGLVAAAGLGLFAYNASFALQRGNMKVPVDVPVAAAQPPSAGASLPSKKSEASNDDDSDKDTATKSRTSRSVKASRSTTRHHSSSAVRERTASKKPKGSKMSEFDPMNEQL